MGNLNGRSAADYKAWTGIIGTYGINKMNSNGNLLLSFYSRHSLAKPNIFFNLKDEYKISLVTQDLNISLIFTI